MTRLVFALPVLPACLAWAGCCLIIVLPPDCSQLCCPGESCDDNGNGNGSGGSGRPLPTGMTAVRLISRSDVGARVTIRFLAEGADPYVAEVGVSARAQTEVAGPDDTTTIEVGGTYDNGDSLPAVTFTRGKDFDSGKAAIYSIPNTGVPANAAPTISVAEPAGDETVPPGGPLRIAWTDEDPDDNATIVAYLEPVDVSGADIRLTPEIVEDPDGPGQDDVTVAIPSGTPTGTYAVLVTISDGRAFATARSRGRVTVGTPAPPVCSNAPMIASIEPASARRNTSVRVAAGGSGFALGSAVRLARSGASSIGGSLVFIATDGTSVVCDFDLVGAEPGARDVVVSVPNCADATLPDAFTVESSPDFDGDADVDSEDFQLLLLCTNGPNRPPPTGVSGCTWADFDSDGDVDGVDSVVFFACFNGPGRSPACG